MAAARRHLFDYPVRSGDKRRGRVEPKRAGSLQVNDPLEFIGLIDRDIARLGPVEDLVHVLQNLQALGDDFELCIDTDTGEVAPGDARGA